MADVPARRLQLLLPVLERPLAGLPLGFEQALLTGVPLDPEDPLAGLPRVGGRARVLGPAASGCAEGAERVVRGGHGT